MKISDVCAPVLCLLWLQGTPALLSTPEEVTGALGGSLSISCHYSQKYRDYTKYWCKGWNYDHCRIVVKTPRNRQNNRTFIVDHKEKGFFTVTMTSLEEWDDDKYWCVIARAGRNIYSGIRLRIVHTVSTINTTILSTSASVVQDEIWRWWAVLRWILFILLLCCLILTHIFEWKITSSKTAFMEQFQCQTCLRRIRKNTGF